MVCTLPDVIKGTTAIKHSEMTSTVAYSIYIVVHKYETDLDVQIGMNIYHVVT